MARSKRLDVEPIGTCRNLQVVGPPKSPKPNGKTTAKMSKNEKKKKKTSLKLIHYHQNIPHTCNVSRFVLPTASVKAWIPSRNAECCCDTTFEQYQVPSTLSPTFSSMTSHLLFHPHPETETLPSPWAPPGNRCQSLSGSKALRSGKISLRQ